MATKTKTKTKTKTAKPPAEDDVSAVDAASKVPSPAPSSPDTDVDTDADAQMKKRKAPNADLPELEVDLSLPEPPSKRAKRALKKGKPLPPKPHSDDGEDEEEKDAKDKTAPKERSQFGIWIGNLPFSVTRPQLFQWLVDSSGGVITEPLITRVNLPTKKRAAAVDKDTKPPLLNKGFAYVDFATYEAQIAAVALSETELAGRAVLIKDSKSFDGRPAKAKEGGPTEGGDGATGTGTGSDAATATAAAHTGSTKIFVGNLGFDVTEDDLRRHFAPCGPVAWAKVATFPDNTEKCRGYGWVQFGRPGAASGQNGHQSTEDTDIVNVSIVPGSSPAEVAAAAAASAFKGFVKIKETVETEEDFVAEAEADGNDNDNDNDTTAKPTRTRTRKWWVNMLKGRPLKIQFAEDDKVRYNKRFRGKGQQSSHHHQQQQQQQRRPRQQKRQEDAAENSTGTNTATDKPYKLQDLSIAQRTGAVTASLGKKTILE